MINKNIKTLLYIFFLILSMNLHSIEFEGNGTSVFNIINEKKLPDGTHYSFFEVQGGIIFNTGKYARSNCSGNRIDKMDELLELRNICEVEFDDGHKMWTKFKRSNSDVDVGVGGFQILEGTGPYSKLKGIECLYAVSFLKDIIFTKSKCDISEKLFEQLKIK